MGPIAAISDVASAVSLVLKMVTKPTETYARGIYLVKHEKTTNLVISVV